MPKHQQPHDVKTTGPHSFPPNLELSPAPLSLPEELARDLLIFKVKGGSMLDELIQNGDLLLIKPCSAVPDGATVLARVRGEAMVKRFFRDNAKVRLESAQIKLEPAVVDEADVEVYGLVAAIVRKY